MPLFCNISIFGAQADLNYVLPDPVKEGCRHSDPVRRSERDVTSQGPWVPPVCTPREAKKLCNINC